MVEDGERDRPARNPLAEWMLAGGEEPDPRFTLANERTFLAWIRTALALLAGGVGLEAFTAGIFPEPIRQIVATLLLVLAFLLSIGSCVRWLRVERAMRRSTPLPVPMIVPFLALGGAAAAVALVVLILVRS